MFKYTGWCYRPGLPGVSRLSDTVVLRRKVCSLCAAVVFLGLLLIWWALTGTSSDAFVASRAYTPFPDELATWSSLPDEWWRASPASHVEGVDTLHHAAVPSGGVPYLDAKTGSGESAQWWNLHDAFGKLARVVWEHGMVCLSAPHLGVPLSIAVFRFDGEGDTIKTYGAPVGAVDAASVPRVLTLPPHCGTEDGTAAGDDFGLGPDDDFTCVHQETEAEARAHGHHRTNRLGGGSDTPNPNSTTTTTTTTTSPSAGCSAVDDSVYLFVANVECEPASQSGIHVHTERDFRETSTLCPGVGRRQTRSGHASCTGDVLINGNSLSRMVFDVAGIEAAYVLHMSEVLSARPCHVCTPDDEE